MVDLFTTSLISKYNNMPKYGMKKWVSLLLPLAKESMLQTG
jgi:hypothetical protein